MIFLLLLSLLIFAFLLKGMQIVPHQQAWIVQRLGKYFRTLDSGPNFLIPFVDTVAYRHSLKEEAVEVPKQAAITQDNVTIFLDGIVYVKIVDPVAASYGVRDPILAVTQLVQTTMRSEIGKIPLDTTFEERETLNGSIVAAINKASQTWGIKCLRYEIRDIEIPDEIRRAMELQMTAERQKRARILESEGLRQAQINESEGQRQAQINIAEGGKARVVLESEAAQIDRLNRARGEAEAILAITTAEAQGIRHIAIALNESGGERAASLQIAEKYLQGFEKLAKEGTTILLPSDIRHPAAMVSQALSIYDLLQLKKPAAAGVGSAD